MARCIFMMLDGVGVGALPDAADYGDTGSNTLGNLARVVDLRLPVFEKMGLGNILPLPGVPPASRPQAMIGRLAPHSAGKDTTVGHWEHMGLVTPRPFPTYPNGFPEEVLKPFREQIGRGVLGNRAASGTQIIDELGEEHLATGFPIVYTSADSVFQIAAHVELVPLPMLYEWCEIARQILTGPHAVARVIARPFTGAPSAFVRTKDRRDFSLSPPGPLYLDLLQDAEIPVHALGKIKEIYTGRGISSSHKVASNADNLEQLRAALRDIKQGLIFTNLVDFDMAWGHRNDVEGFARGLAAVDRALPDILGDLKPDDLLFLSADHGVDPTTVSTDHSREYVPLLLYPRPPGTRPACFEGDFADTGATIYAHLTGKVPALAGRSALEQRPSRGWRHYPAALADPRAPKNHPRRVPGRVGEQEATTAASWLETRLGPAPDIAVVLGSGLQRLFGSEDGDALRDEEHHGERGHFGARYGGAYYADVPRWAVGTVPGHPSTLSVFERNGLRLVALRGRIHGYEGFDLSEQQLQVRTLARWGVRKLILTNACGAVDSSLAAGDVVLVTEILDFQAAAPGTCPLTIGATEAGIIAALCPPTSQPAPQGRGRVVTATGVYAAVPGPQYETAAEVEVLRAIGAAVVGMSTAAEARAAADTGMRLAVLAVVTNPGTTSASGAVQSAGVFDAHRAVLASADLASGRVLEAVDAVLEAWGRR